MKSQKNKQSSLEGKRLLFFEIGMILSLALVLAAFEWKTTYQVKTIEEKVDIPITGHWNKPTKPEPPKKPPKETKHATEINITKEEPDLGLDEIKIFFGGEDDTDPTKYSGRVKIDDEFQKDDDFVLMASTMPAFPGGESARHKYLRSNTEYPVIARKANITGTVYVEFIVEKDGTISNARVLRGPHESLNEEAIRVVRNMPDWSPGKQGIQKVRVQMVMPVKFKLR